MRPLALGLLAALGLTQAGQPERLILLPAVALEAAGRGAVPLAYVLAGVGVSAGVVTLENPSEPAFAWTRLRIDEAPTVSLDAVLARFATAFPSYEIDRAAGAATAVTIEPPESRCAEAIDRPLGKPLEIHADQSRALALISWFVSGEAETPRAILSGLPRRAGLAESIPVVQLSLTEKDTVRAAFDQAVQAGGAWLVWEHTRSDRQTGCRSVAFLQNGQVGASPGDFATFK